MVNMSRIARIKRGRRKGKPKDKKKREEEAKKKKATKQLKSLGLDGDFNMKELMKMLETIPSKQKKKALKLLKKAGVEDMLTTTNNHNHIHSENCGCAHENDILENFENFNDDDDDIPDLVGNFENFANDDSPPDLVELIKREDECKKELEDALVDEIQLKRKIQEIIPNLKNELEEILPEDEKLREEIQKLMIPELNINKKTQKKMKPPNNSELLKLIQSEKNKIKPPNNSELLKLIQSEKKENKMKLPNSNEKRDERRDEILEILQLRTKDKLEIIPEEFDEIQEMEVLTDKIEQKINETSQNLILEEMSEVPTIPKLDILELEKTTGDETIYV